MSAEPRAQRRRTALAGRLGLAPAEENARLAAELAELRDRLQSVESGLSAAIGQLQEWSTNQDRELGEVRGWLGALEAEVRRKDALRSGTDRAIFVAIDRLTEIHRRVGAAPAEDSGAGDLSGRELRAFSQHGEDGVIAEILRRVGAPERSFVEFGVESGREGNCVFLADVAGYDGLFIEAAPDDFAQLERKYASRPEIRTRREFVTADNVERIFADAGVPEEPAVLSIDVDGADYWIWEAIVAYRPRLTVIEYNSVLPSERRLVQPRELEGGWDGTDYFGASLGAVISLGAEKGYRLVHVDLSALNAFLVREDLAADRFPAPDQIDHRGLPNYFHVGARHPRDTQGRRYFDLDSGRLVTLEPGEAY